MDSFLFICNLHYYTAFIETIGNSCCNYKTGRPCISKAWPKYRKSLRIYYLKMRRIFINYLCAQIIG